jgi:hypothetical protein
MIIKWTTLQPTTNQFDPHPTIIICSLISKLMLPSNHFLYSRSSLVPSFLMIILYAFLVSSIRTTYPVQHTLLPYHYVILGGLLVSVLATGPEVRWIKPGRGKWILRAIKIQSTPSFRGEVQPLAPCRKILRYVE